jgi:hypothetical protein
MTVTGEVKGGKDRAIVANRLACLSFPAHDGPALVARGGEPCRLT